MMIFEDRVGFYTMKEVCRITALSRSTIYRYLERKKFPEPTTFEDGGNLKFWIPHVHAWIRENLAQLARAMAAGRKRRGWKVRAKNRIRALGDIGKDAAGPSAQTVEDGRQLAEVDP